jgi:hypothetical protein
VRLATVTRVVRMAVKELQASRGALRRRRRRAKFQIEAREKAFKMLSSAYG